MLADYHRTRPIVERRESRPGHQASTLHRAETGVACMRPVYEEFDIAEMSLSWYVMARSRNEPVIALPIFPLRMQIHPYIFCSPASGIERPEDLKGKKIGMDQYRLTVGLWARGILQEHYGVRPQDCHWFTSEPETEDAGFQLPANVEHHLRQQVHRSNAPARRTRRLDPAQHRAVVPQPRPAHSPCLQRHSRHRQRLFSQDQNLSDHAHAGGAPRAVRRTAVAGVEPARSIQRS